jgi:hypothetical protein
VNQNKVFNVSGVLRINTNVHFNNCVFVMASGSKIEVVDGRQLRAVKCRFIPCSNMWAGIELQRNATLFLRDCRVEGALYAINSSGLSTSQNPALSYKSPTINLVRDTFNRNHIGIYRVNQRPTYHVARFDSNLFDSHGGVPALGTLGQNVSEVVNLYCPITGLAAIWVENLVESFSDPVFKTARNSVRNLRYGIHAQGGYTVIERFDFEHMIQPTNHESCQLPQTLNGFFALYGTAVDLTIGAYILVKNCTFKDNHYGVSSMGSFAHVGSPQPYGQGINVFTGYSTAAVKSRTTPLQFGGLLRVYDNAFKCSGITINVQRPVSNINQYPIVHIENNSIDRMSYPLPGVNNIPNYNSLEGIGLTVNFNDQVSRVWINNNRINNNQPNTGALGSIAAYYSGLSVFNSNNVVIENNLLKQTVPITSGVFDINNAGLLGGRRHIALYGIGRNNRLSSNDIDGFNIQGAQSVAAISGARATGWCVNNNTTNNTGVGLLFVGNNFFPNRLQIVGNQMYRHHVGSAHTRLFLAPVPEQWENYYMDNQINTGNRWIGGFEEYGARAAYLETGCGKFLISNNLPSEYAPTMPPNELGQLIGTTNQPLQTGCRPDVAPADLVIPVIQNGGFENDAELSPYEQWYKTVELLVLLMEDPDFQTPFYQNFVNSYLGTSAYEFANYFVQWHQHTKTLPAIDSIILSLDSMNWQLHADYTRLAELQEAFFTAYDSLDQTIDDSLTLISLDMMANATALGLAFDQQKNVSLQSYYTLSQIAAQLNTDNALDRMLPKRMIQLDLDFFAGVQSLSDSVIQQEFLNIVTSGLPETGRAHEWAASRLRGCFADNYKQWLQNQQAQQLVQSNNTPKILLMPNPATYEVWCSVKDVDLVDGQITDHLGRHVGAGTMSKGRVQFNVESLPNGFYFVQLTAQNGKIFADKLVVEH